MNPHDEQKITARDEAKKARDARRASAAAFLPANDRFKQSYSALTYLGLILATAVHFAVFEFFPQLEAADLGSVSEELTAIELPPEVRIPPPPDVKKEKSRKDKYGHLHIALGTWVFCYLFCYWCCVVYVFRFKSCHYNSVLLNR